MERLSWILPEYEEKEKNTDWFWALGIIIVAGSITSIIYHNYFFSILIVLGGILVGVFANKKPELVNYQLNKEGLQIKNRIFPFKEINSYCVNTDKIPTLMIHTKRFMFPIVSVPIEYRNKDQIINIFSNQNIKEEELKENIIEKLIEYIDF
ncbi:MAG: hypothetical protein M3P22_00690 [bacterium]|nr:hypothetical protein [bacterium]